MQRSEPGGEAPLAPDIPTPSYNYPKRGPLFQKQRNLPLHSASQTACIYNAVTGCATLVQFTSHHITAYSCGSCAPMVLSSMCACWYLVSEVVSALDMAGAFTVKHVHCTFATSLALFPPVWQFCCSPVWQFCNRSLEALPERAAACIHGS